ncbi:MAG: ATP synthase F1 subunit epsilon [Planctomycetota bacterium]
MSEFHLRVITPARTVIDRKVRSVTFMGVDGSYGVLPGHAPMMTATEPGIVSVENADGTTEHLLVTDGLAEMRNNVLSLICEAGERADEIDLARAEEAELKARERIAGGVTQGVDLPRAQRSLRRAALRQLISKRAGTGDLR